ncbi:MAG TPA: hypothetical protein ENH46_07040 [Candidatus Pacearchaeota archaeon]|nr:hypothetical protein [Candidatus Pacearchaeota archaeon]
MVQVYNEKLNSDFKGTIIDIETIGNFCKFQDSRAYKEITPVIFGFINKNGLSILCAKKKESIELLKNKINEILEKLERPFHAFNCDFEVGVFHHSLNKKIVFENELNAEKYEAKRNAVSLLKIPQYDDPFFDNGRLCMEAWLSGQIEKATAHNRSCLLKEKDILLKRGFRKPDELKFYDS